MVRLIVIGLMLLILPSVALAEKVNVKYRGEVDLGPFTCHTIQQSSFVNRVCYDSANSYMLISLKGTYYHYCAIDAATVNALLQANSIGTYYNQNIKGRFDCRVNKIPVYQ